MSIHTPLFEGRLVSLSAIDHDQDPQVESRWTHNPLYLRMLGPEPAIPQAPYLVQKKYETIEKSMQDENSLFYFAVRAQPQEADAPELLIGFAKLYWFEWTNRNCYVQLGIGDPANWHKGFGADILHLMLHFAFAELNMHRLTGLIPAYNQSALALFTKTGFQEEVCSRQALHRDGQRWDLLHYGLLQREWQAVAA